MVLSFRPFLAGALLVWGQVVAAQVIDGTVVDSVTGAPVSGASVQIENAGKAPYQTTSDSQGAFHIEGVADGSYTALAFKSGYQTVQDEAAKRPFHVINGLDAVHLKLALTPRGRISGRILDANDQPVAGADVWLMQGNGAGQSGSSDASGGFSFDVVPGSYVLSARAPANLKPPDPVGDQRQAWVKTWFPGVTQAGEAQKILVHPGAELVGQDIKLESANAYRIRGQIRGSNGDPAARIGVKLVRTGDTQPMERSTLSDKEGRFDFTDVYDGDWRLAAEQSGDPALRAVAGVTITGRDAEAELRLNPPFGIPIQFVLETSDSTVAIPGQVLLAPEWGGASVTSTWDKYGISRLGGVYPGRYLVNALPPGGANYYVASIKLGERDILGQIVEFSPGAPPLKIVYRSDGGTIRGTVENCGKATIAIAPQDPLLQHGDTTAVRLAHCGDNGQFEMRSLHPGKYYAFAFNPFEMNASSFMANLPGLINKAVTVDVTANQSASVELKVTSVF